MNEFTIEGFQSSEGLPNAKIGLGNKIVTLHSVSPYKEAERVVSKFNPSLNWVIIAGFGLGYVVEHILQNTNFSVILFEYEDAIMDYADSIGRLKPFISSERVHLIRHDIQQLTDFLEENFIKELNFYIHRPYLSFNPDIYSNLEGVLIAYLSKKQINKATLKRFQKVWLRNIIKNSRFYFSTPGIRHIRHPYAGKPCVIVGAGPSLGKNIRILKEIQDRIIIIATDTALSILCENAVRADFVVSVDPQEKNTLYLLYSKCKDAALVIDAGSSYISISRYPKSKTFVYDNVFPLYEEMKPFWGEKGSLLSGGSVSTTAFDLARYFQCSPILFIGQDLAFSKKETHVKGSTLEEFLYYRINRIHSYEEYNSKTLLFSDKIEVKSSDGGKVWTDRKFVTFLDWFKKEIKLTDAPVINATEGGAFIEGAEHLSLKEASERYQMNTPLNKNFTVEYSSSSQAPFLDYLRNLLQEIQKLIPLAAAAYRAVQSLGEPSPYKKNAFFSQMTRFDQTLLSAIKNSGSIGRFIELTMQDSIESIIESSQYDRLNQELLEKWEVFYREAFQGLMHIEGLLKKRIAMGSAGK